MARNLHAGSDIGAASRVLARYGLTVTSASATTASSDALAETPHNSRSNPVQCYGDVATVRLENGRTYSEL